MSSDPYRDASQPPKPPTDRLSEFYSSARSAPDGIPVVSRRLYVDIYKKVHNFCDAVNRFYPRVIIPGPQVDDLYRMLEWIVRDHCAQIRMQIFPLDLTTMDTARAGIKVYLAHLQKFKDLAVRVTHLVEHLEKSWVRPGVEAGRNDLLPLRDIHRQRWTEDMLQFDQEGVGNMTGIDFLRKAGGMLLRPGQGRASDEDEELLRSLAGTQAPRSHFRMRGDLMVVSEYG